MTYLPDAFGPTRAAPKGSQGVKHSNAINRTRSTNSIAAENAKMAARLQQIKGKPKKEKKPAKKKAGSSGHGGAVLYDSGLSMEQEWRR